MPNLNKVMIMGHLGKDVEVKLSPSGTAIGEFSLAVTEGIKRNGEWVKETEWFNCVAFGKSAEAISKYTHKGDALFVEGKLKTDKWTDNNGNKRSKTKVVVNNFQFLSGKKSSSQTTSASSEDSGDSIPF